jgi:hypothetical protein
MPRDEDFFWGGLGRVGSSLENSWSICAGVLVRVLFCVWLGRVMLLLSLKWILLDTWEGATFVRN